MLIGPQNLPARVTHVRSRINAAAQAAGRDPAAVTLIAVSKTRSAVAIRAAAAAGIAHIGENYQQEAQPKIDSLADLALCWHFIGVLQTNKTRAVAAAFDWVHTVDRLKIAERLSQQRPFHAPPLNLCLQVALLPEESKGGVAPAALAALAAAVRGLPRLKLRGLMCIPPPSHNPAQQRAFFAQLRALRDELNANGHQLDTLSMGMSEDFEAAIAEGATHVRIGTAIFGARA
jgi:PLP dependent protein